MTILITFLKCAAVLTAAIILGSMFLNEHKKALRRNEPWYRAYLTLPGLLILAALLLPILYWLYTNR